MTLVLVVLLIVSWSITICAVVFAVVARERAFTMYHRGLTWKSLAEALEARAKGEE